MKMKVAYITKDKTVFLDKTEAIQHEAELLGLTVDEYHELEQLEKEERESFLILSGSQNEETIKANDLAIKKVVAFRKAHGLNESENLDD